MQRKRVLSFAPFGYAYIKGTESTEAYYLITSEEAEVVKEMFHLYCPKMFSI